MSAHFSVVLYDQRPAATCYPQSNVNDPAGRADYRTARGSPFRRARLHAISTHPATHAARPAPV
ncbi:MAG: hypothetical protein M3O50_14675, partial [Myxococcota bacterium]|nr:hypothetical protein [Myxococcota bacterium]